MLLESDGITTDHDESGCEESIWQYEISCSGLECVSRQRCGLPDLELDPLQRGTAARFVGEDFRQHDGQHESRYHSTRVESTRSVRDASLSLYEERHRTCMPIVAVADTYNC